MTSPFASAHFTYLHSLILSSSQSPTAFIIKLAAAHSPSSTPSSPSYLVAAALSDHSIHLHLLSLPSPTSPSPLPSLTLLTTLLGHRTPITDLRFFNDHPSSAPPSSPLLLSSSDDGCVTAWDCQSYQARLSLRCPGPVFSCAGWSRFVLVGCGSAVLLYDLVSARLLREFPDFHTDDVTAVAFHPVDGRQMFSASLDGTLCHFNTLGSDPDDPDETLVASMQLEADVSRIGFFGPQAEYLYAITTTEQLSLWHVDRALRVSTLEGADVRVAMGRAVGCHIDYLVDCAYEREAQRLYLLAGNNNGSVALFHVNRGALQPVWSHVSENVTDYNSVAEKDVRVSIWVDEAEADADALLHRAEQKEAGDEEKDAGGMSDEGDISAAVVEEKAETLNLSGAGHVATVRDVLWLGNVLLTGGNDGKLCVWSSDERLRGVKAAGHSMRSSTADMQHA